MERKVRCIDLDNFVVQQGIHRVDFMKLDTEGLRIIYSSRRAKAADARPSDYRYGIQSD